MRKLIGDKMISQSGADWVTIAADPFHDNALPNLCGYPQAGVNGQSIVLKVPYQMTISAPTGLPPGATWQFMLCRYPWLGGQSGAPAALIGYTSYGNYLTTAGSLSPSNDNAQSVSIYRGPDGTDLGPFQTGLGGNSNDVLGMSLEPAYSIGPHREIASGIEVYDTTAVVERQGTCTVWRQNANTEDRTAWTYASAPLGLPINSWGAASGVIVRRPPQNIAEANKLMGTRSWKSEDGCYLVDLLNNEPVIKQPDDTQPIIFSRDVALGQRVAGGSAQVLSGPVNNQVVSAGQSISYPQNLWDFQPYQMSGCFFTGLKQSATFLVRTVFYIERFPTPDEPDIVLVTKPSAVYDPMALEIYDQMLHRMPPGVPVADNGLGEWFFDGIKAAASAIFPGVGRFLGNLGSSPPAPIKKPNSTAAIKYPKALPQAKPLVIRSPPPRRVKPTKRQVDNEAIKLIKQKHAQGKTLSRREIEILMGVPS